MPMTVNGFGTSVCGGRGDIGWGSFDGMEWFVAAFMPIIPYKAVHTFDWQGEQYRAIPIRWSAELMARTFLARWMWALMLVGVVLGFIGVVDKRGVNVGLLAAGLVMVPLGIVIGILLRVTDRRNKDVRLVLGPVTIGNCDPANLPGNTLDEMVKPSQIAYGTKTFAAAVERLLEEGRFAQAMWAARVSTALEGAAEGEALTNMVLQHPEVKDALDRVRVNAQDWARYMLNDSERQPPPEEPVDAVPAADEDRVKGLAHDDRLRGEDDRDRPRRVRGEEDDDRRRRRDEDY
jgi:hypothetical protein